MSWKFNPPPGWPAQPEGWVPPPGWIPDPSWPPAPPGWQFWVAAGADQPAAPAYPQAMAPTRTEPAPPYSSAPGAPGFAPAGSGPPPFSSPSAPPFGSAPPMANPAYGGAPPYGQHPGGPAAAKPWFSTWWAILLLVVLLLIGSAAGFGGTRLALSSSEEPDTNATAGGDPARSETPAQGDPPGPAATGTPDLTLPTLPPLPTPGGDLSTACGEVGLIMIEMALAPLEEAEEGDYDTYVAAVVDSRRAAASEIRELDGEDTAQQDALDALAGELDGAADMLADDPYDQDNVDGSADRVNTAYETFTNDSC